MATGSIPPLRLRRRCVGACPRMGYRNLRECLDDLETHRGQLVRIEQEIDPHLEAAEIQRRVYQAGGPAIYFARVKGCRFPMVSNLFGTLERMRFIFRDTLDAVERLIELKVDPARGAAAAAGDISGRCGRLRHMLPRARSQRAGVWRIETTIDQLPQLQSWPDDGGAFITLPLVYTEDPERPGLARARTWACTACSFPAASIGRTRRSGCIIRSIAASACIMPRRFGAASRCG